MLSKVDERLGWRRKFGCWQRNSINPNFSSTLFCRALHMVRSWLTNLFLVDSQQHTTSQQANSNLCRKTVNMMMKGAHTLHMEDRKLETQGSNILLNNIPVHSSCKKYPLIHQVL
jgi:hypothetical protein